MMHGSKNISKGENSDIDIDKLIDIIISNRD
jgi:hypothetical protein